MKSLLTHLGYCLIIWLSWTLLNVQCTLVCTAGEWKGDNDISCQTETDTQHINTWVYAEPEKPIDCCGVVTAWRFSVGTSDGFDFQIWKDVDLGTGTATFVGRNTVAETQINSNSINTLTITDPAQMIPIQPGYAIGWLPYAYDVIKIDKLAGSCTYHSASWMSHDYTLDSHVPDYGDPPMTFETKGGTDVISFAVQVQVGPGTAPVFTNLDATVSVNHDATVGTSVYTVTATDVNTQQQLSFSLSSPVFSIDSTSGEVKVSGDLSTGSSVYQLSIIVSDTCLTTTGKLTININKPSGGGGGGGVTTTTTAAKPINQLTTKTTTTPSSVVLRTTTTANNGGGGVPDTEATTVAFVDTPAGQGAIAGAVLGAAALATTIGLLAGLLPRRKNNADEEEESPATDDTASAPSGVAEGATTMASSGDAPSTLTEVQV